MVFVTVSAEVFSDSAHVNLHTCVFLVYVPCHIYLSIALIFPVAPVSVKKCHSVVDMVRAQHMEQLLLWQVRHFFYM